MLFFVVVVAAAAATAATAAAAAAAAADVICFIRHQNTYRTHIYFNIKPIT